MADIRALGRASLAAAALLALSGAGASAWIEATTERVNVATSGAQANGGSYFPAISVNGRFVAFESDATNLVPHDRNGARDIFVHDRKTGRTERVSVGSGG